MILEESDPGLSRCTASAFEDVKREPLVVTSLLKPMRGRIAQSGKIFPGEKHTGIGPLITMAQLRPLQAGKGNEQEKRQRQHQPDPRATGCCGSWIFHVLHVPWFYSRAQRPQSSNRHPQIGPRLFKNRGWGLQSRSVRGTTCPLAIVAALCKRQALIGFYLQHALFCSGGKIG